MIPQISVIPAPFLPVPVERQQKIIDGINAKLRENPRQGFCLMGRPGTGKTYLMRAIQKAVVAAHQPKSKLFESCVSPIICTLAEWQEARVSRVRGESAPLASEVSPKRIKAIASENEAECGRFLNPIPVTVPWTTFHLFIDEFDSQPTNSQFAQDGLQSLINTVYQYASRNRAGNEQDFCQLVLATNRTWQEFEATFGQHIARRIAEMCAIVPFGPEFEESVKHMKIAEPHFNKATNAIDGLCA